MDINEEFQKVFLKEPDSTIPTTHMFESDQIQQADFSVDGARNILTRLKEESAPGPDGIPLKLHKECASVLAYPLWILFRATLSTGTIPEAWKEVNITPIFKKRDKTDPQNNHPLLLLFYVCLHCDRMGFIKSPA